MIRLLQMIEFFLYINTETPSNYSAFIQILTITIYDFLPNFFAGIADDELGSARERLADNEFMVNLFANLGAMFSLFLILFGIKLLAQLLRWLSRSSANRISRISSKIYGYLSFEYFYRQVEGYHLDIAISQIVLYNEMKRLGLEVN